MKGRSFPSDEPPLMAGVLIGSIVAAAVIAIVIPEAKLRLAAPAAQGAAPRAECPMPTVNETAVITVRYTEQNTIETSCAIVVSRGQRKREGL